MLRAISTLAASLIDREARGSDLKNQRVDATVGFRRHGGGVGRPGWRKADMAEARKNTMVSHHRDLARSMQLDA